MLQVVYVVSGILVLLLQTVWSLWLIALIIITGQVLRSLPYLQTRFQQLPYRFFVLQASLFAAVILFEYVHAIVKLARSSKDTNLGLIADDLNMLLRMQVQPFGKILFISTYVYLLIYLYLPPTPGTQSKHLTTSFVFEEEALREHFRQERARKDEARSRMRSSDSSTRSPLKAMEAYLEAPPPFCVETACWLMEMSWEAYNDAEGRKTLSGFEPVDIAQHGFELAEFISNEPTDTHAFLARHKSESKLVLAFRGSSSNTHWFHNLRFAQTEINLETMQPVAGGTLVWGLDAQAALAAMHDEEDEEDNSAFAAIASLLQRGGQELPSLNELAHGGGDERSMGSDESEDGQLRPQAVASMLKRQARKLNSNVRRSADKLREEIEHSAAWVGDHLEHSLESLHLERLPVLSKVLRGAVHTGFWESYLSIRAEVQRALRRALRQSLIRPTSSDSLELYITGHSLGGALATLAAFDVAVNILPRVNRRRHHFQLPPVSITMYNFGSPRVGSYAFSSVYQGLIPNTFRVVVDGDIVSGVPSAWYKHVGTEVVVDREGAGNFICDPSFVERTFHTMARRNLSSHSLVM